ncbi:MAG: AAA family ATPase [Cyanobacteriota bacterium]
MNPGILDCGQRIAVVGTTGSGKTTLARQLAQQLAIPHVELDALHWQPNWTPASVSIFRDRVSQALSGNNWVVDGNYSKIRDIVWSRADTIVWLDYPLPVIMRRLLRRTWRRVVMQEELWSGNRETWQQTFSRDSILLWALKTYRKKRKEYPLLFQNQEYAHLTVIRLNSPKVTDAWLANLTA